MIRTWLDEKISWLCRESIKSGRTKGSLDPIALSSSLASAFKGDYLRLLRDDPPDVLRRWGGVNGVGGFDVESFFKDQICLDSAIIDYLVSPNSDYDRSYLWVDGDLALDLISGRSPDVEFFGTHIRPRSAVYVDFTGASISAKDGSILRALVVIPTDVGALIFTVHQDNDRSMVTFDFYRERDNFCFFIETRETVSLFKNVWLYLKSANREPGEGSPLQKKINVSEIAATRRPNKGLSRLRNFSLFNVVPLKPAKRLIPTSSRAPVSADGTTNLTVRFEVRGHWRWQPKGIGSRKDPSKLTHELIWIEAHEKGPAGAPKKLPLIAMEAPTP